MSVCLFVCVFVRHTFSLCLTVFLPQLPEAKCTNLLDIPNPWGTVMEESGLRFEHFFKKWSKSAAAKIFFFYRFFYFSLCLKVFLPPIPKVQRQNFLDILIPWGKVMERNGLRYELFFSKRMEDIL